MKKQIKVEKEEVKETYKAWNEGDAYNKKLEVNGVQIPGISFIDASGALDHPIHRVGFEDHWEHCELFNDLTNGKFFPGQKKFNDVEIKYI